MAERDVILDVTPEDYDAMASPFIEIPIGASGRPEAGDECYLLVEAQANIGEKTPGVSYQVPLMIMEEGVNKGKVVDWYPGYRGQALNIFKRGLEAFDKEDVVESIKGKMHLYIDRIAGAQAKARFVREWSNPQEAGKKPILRAVLDSTQFIGAEEEPPTVEELV